MAHAAGVDDPVAIESALRLGRQALARSTLAEPGIDAIRRLVGQLAGRLPGRLEMPFEDYGDFLQKCAHTHWSSRCRTPPPPPINRRRSVVRPD